LTVLGLRFSHRDYGRDKFRINLLVSLKGIRIRELPTVSIAEFGNNGLLGVLTIAARLTNILRWRCEGLPRRNLSALLLVF